MALSVKHLLIYSFAIFAGTCLSAQKTPAGSMAKIDSIYGYKTIKLESSYASIKHLLGPKQSLSIHEYSCVVTDTSYLKSNLLLSQTINLSFFDDKIRTIYVQIHDSVNVPEALTSLISTYGADYIVPFGQHENSETIPNDKSYLWSGKSSSANYTIFSYPLSNGSISWNGSMTFKSKAMECYASKVLGEKYWSEEEGGIRCPRVDPCTP